MNTIIIGDTGNISSVTAEHLHAIGHNITTSDFVKGLAGLIGNRNALGIIVPPVY